MNSQEKFVSCLGVLAVAIGFTIVGAVLNGWALSVLWGWFIVPVLKVPQLTILQAIGVAMVVSFLTKNYSTSDKSKGTADLIGDLIAATLINPVLTIGLGWIVLQFS